MANTVETSGAVLHISSRAAARIRLGHLWIYRSDLERGVLEARGVLEERGVLELDSSSLVTIVDPRGRPLGSALYSESSEIAARIVSLRPHLTRGDYLAE